MSRSFFDRFSRSLPRAGLIVALVIALDLLAMVASVAAPRMTVTMDKASIRAVGGHSFEYTVQRGRWFPFFPYYPQGDTLSDPFASNLVLREDGTLLGPAHSLSQEVKDTGMGMYSHRDRNLFFSSSDGTDPRSNAHTYTFTYYPVVDRRLLLALLLANVVLVASRIRKRPAFRMMLALVVALDLVALVASVAAPRMTVTMDKASIRPAGGHSFEYTVQRGRWLPFFPYYPQGDTLSERIASNLVLREDGALLGPAHAVLQEVEDTGMGMYSHWNEDLFFSSSDGTDPRSNAHTYTFTYYPVVDRRLLLALLLANVVLVASRTWRYLIAIPGYVAGRRRRIRAYAVAAIPPVAVSAFLFAYLPPIWNGTDSTGFLMFDPLSFVPHFAILYPLLMDTVRRLFGVSNATILSVQLLQHFLLIASIAYLATAGRRMVSILILSVAACIGATLNLYAHGIFTEGLALPFLIFQVGAFVRIVRFGRWWSPAMVVYTVSLLLEMLTRENFILFGALLPAYSLAALIVERETVAARLTQVAIGAGICVAVFAVGEVALVQYCDRIGQPSTSVFGRQGSYRMVETGSLLSEADRQRFIERMQAETDDPAVKFAIDRMVMNPHPWLATRDEIKASPLLRDRDPDEVMNTAFFIYLRTYEPASQTQLMIELRSYFFPMSSTGLWMRPSGLYSYMLPYSTYSIGTYRQSSAIWSQVGSIGYLSSPLIYRYAELLNNPLVRLLDIISPAVLVGLVCVLVAAGRLSGLTRSETGYAAISLVVAAATCALFSAIVTVTIPRYLTPLNLVLWVGLGLVVVDMVGSKVKQPWGRARGEQKPCVESAAR